ncbi:SDR family NAD(P)-dependent oxidoreductase [Candidatus Poriferisocius sp.]|uniref:SDR family NAD(P)-dependent oxidoreductase n=1 Tax=Candidatus Poriferisocius sp. TaxID=3101276 RepID=UPI003B5BBFD7
MSVQIDHAGKVALVTGSGAGIGREIARWLARAGAAVAVNDVRAEPAAETVELIAGEGGTAAPHVADLRGDEAIEQLVAGVVDRWGRLDIAVNNVGMMAGRGVARFVDTDGAHWRDILDQNVVLTALCGRAEARVMMEQGGGVILNVSSGETTRPSPMMSSYAAAKAAINHLTWSMAVELGPHGIRVNAVAPGTTLTEVVKEAFPADHYQEIVAATPLRRETLPEELGRLCVYLASDLARCTTGQLILADAGAFLSRGRPPNLGSESLIKETP